MNRYSRKILKRIATPGTDKSREALNEIFCISIVNQCLDDLVCKGYIKHTDVIYNINDGFSPVEADDFYVTLVGLDALEDSKQNTFQYWVPVGISSVLSLIAIAISVIK